MYPVQNQSIIIRNYMHRERWCDKKGQKHKLPKTQPHTHTKKERKKAGQKARKKQKSKGKEERKKASVESMYLDNQVQ
jgi:hypothetical protein